MLIDGIYLDGKTSKRHNARLEVVNDHKLTRIHLTEQQQSLSFEFNQCNIESRLGNTPREIAFTDAQLFITNNNDDIDTFSQWQNNENKKSFLYHLENNIPLISVFTIAAILLLYSTIVYGIPSAAKVIDHNAPSFTSDKLFSSLDILDETVFEPSELSTKKQQRIRKLVAPYLANHHDLQPKLEFRSGMQANALALPNGVIVFTDDFVELAQSDNQLLAVLFHELGHLKHKHMTQRLLQDAMITLLVVFITGDVETFDLITGLPTLILDMAHSRGFELEADNYALQQLNQHNIPLQSFVLIMQNLGSYYHEKNDEKSNKLADFISTHPTTEQRIKMAEKFNQQP
ncbi:hypothetical protein CJF42_07085 [Pseudoalteromonas sp. NBT06-2]|uniref:M48 family metallopeptidase n=1 Tax=Pseudoalteromonas sp. NBT06-2 TaxID=2025950 RepID=UPI000BA750A4|nr:M48 family metallopeptidase [Pseudoalteromonas sp. NBT06-2]PAJ75063.1 hypothetical protein CJF42_07085 [Pseudoalteromonas sp. NBT06-2]